MNCQQCKRQMMNMGGAYWCSGCGCVTWGDADYQWEVPYLVVAANLCLGELEAAGGDPFYPKQLKKALQGE